MQPDLAQRGPGVRADVEELGKGLVVLFKTMVGIIVLLLVVVVAQCAWGDWPRWDTVDGHDTLRLERTKVIALVHDDAPYREAVRACVAPADDETLLPASCERLPDDLYHYEVPVGRHDIVTGLYAARDQGRRVTLHVYPLETYPNHHGVPRCVIARLVVHRK